MPAPAAGMRASEIGPVPDNWATFRLGDLYAFRNGVNADKSAYGSGTPFVNILEVITQSHLAVTDVPGRITLGAARRRSYAVRAGDIVFNRTSETQEEVGLAAVYLDDAETVFGGFVIRGRPLSDALDPVFAGYVLRSERVRTQMIAMGQGAIHANIGQVDLAQVFVQVPPMPEQRAIARALLDVDEYIRSIGRLLDGKRQLRVAARRGLLLGLNRLPGFEGDWMRLRLGELGRMGKGQGVRKDEAHSGSLPCVRYGELYTHHNDFIRRFHSFISSDVARGAQRLSMGDLLFAGSGETATEIGKCVAFLGNVEAYAGSDIVILSPVGHDAKFLGYLLNEEPVVRQKARFGQGDAVVHISARNLAEVEIRIPSIDEQRAVAAVLTDIDEEVEAMAARLEKVREIKIAMAQELLSGTTRLV